jgi:hypothetical protein
MIRRMKYLMHSLIFLIMCLTACNSVSDRDADKERQSEDDFYTDRGGFGTFLRVPLIKPYEAQKISKDEWRIHLRITPDILALAIDHVKEINVVDSLILVYSNGGTAIKHVNYKEAWFVIIPSENIEKGFPKKEDFLDYLKAQNVTVSKLHNVDQVYDRFNETQKIDWQKGL